jgi:predicted metal-dependent phosphoesterase TrpH
MEYLINKRIVSHIHTKFSYDSFLEPETIVETAIKNKIEIIIITDHNSIEGAKIAKQYAEKKYTNKLQVLIGEEVLTDIGDIIGFPLKNKINSYNYLDVIKEIKDQGGFVYLPHPYQGHNLFLIHDSNFISNLDFIEIFNSRLNKKENYFAELLQINSGIRPILGSDAHLKSEIMNVSFKFDESFNIYDQVSTRTTLRNIRKVSFIKYFKKRNLVKMLKYLLLILLNK